MLRLEREERKLGNTRRVICRTRLPTLRVHTRQIDALCAGAAGQRDYRCNNCDRLGHSVSPYTDEHIGRDDGSQL
jgi:hypothetical protein